jgi:hypothetical protein
MNFKRLIVFSVFAIVTMVAGQLVLAQDAPVTPADAGLITSGQQAGSLKETDMQWAWGEVTNLDDQAQTVTLKYLDYETDQEKDLVLTVDDKTTFENVKGFNDLKLKDTLSIDYIIAADNKNIAKNISFEKPDAPVSSATETDNSEVADLPPSTEPSAAEAVAPVVPVPAPAVAPDLAQPVAQAVTPADSSVAAAPAPAAPEVESAPAVQAQAQ